MTMGKVRNTNVFTNKEQRVTSQNTTSIMNIYFIQGNKVTTCFGLYQ